MRTKIREKDIRKEFSLGNDNKTPEQRLMLLWKVKMLFSKT